MLHAGLRFGGVLTDDLLLETEDDPSVVSMVPARIENVTIDCWKVINPAAEMLSDGAAESNGRSEAGLERDRMPYETARTGTEREEPGGERPPEEMQSAHPVEPAEGAREPGDEADEPRPPHPVQPAEGERSG